MSLGSLKTKQKKGVGWGRTEDKKHIHGYKWEEHYTYAWSLSGLLVVTCSLWELCKAQIDGLSTQAACCVLPCTERTGEHVNKPLTQKNGGTHQSTLSKQATPALTMQLLSHLSILTTTTKKRRERKGRRRQERKKQEEHKKKKLLTIFSVEYNFDLISQLADLQQWSELIYKIKLSCYNDQNWHTKSNCHVMPTHTHGGGGEGRRDMWVCWKP